MVDIIGQDVGLVPIYPLVRIFSVFVLKIEHNDAQQRTTLWMVTRRILLIINGWFRWSWCVSKCLSYWDFCKRSDLLFIYILCSLPLTTILAIMESNNPACKLCICFLHVLAQVLLFENGWYRIVYGSINFFFGLWPYHTYTHGPPKKLSKIPTLR